MSIDVDRKRSRGRPKVESELVCARIAEPLLGQLDAWIASQLDPRPTRPEAVRTALRDWLATKSAPAVADTETAINDRIEALEAKVASLPHHDSGPSPDAAMNTMRKALAEAELVGLRQKRKRVRKATSK